MRIINDISFEPYIKRGTKGGLNKDTILEEVAPCLCGETMPNALAELASLRGTLPEKEY